MAREKGGICIKPEGANHLTGYRTYGCGCDDCTEANRVAVRRWRWRTGTTKSKLVPITATDVEKAKRG